MDEPESDCQNRRLGEDTDEDASKKRPVCLLKDDDGIPVSEQVRALEERVTDLESFCQLMTEENDLLRRVLDQREDSISWKFCQIYGRLIPPGTCRARMIHTPLSWALHAVENLIGADKESSRKRNECYRQELSRILESCREPCKGIILFPPTMEWNHPLFQRPQQLSLALADLGYLVFFCTRPEKTFDRVSGFLKVNDRCYVSDQYYLLIEELPPFLCIYPSTYVVPDYHEIRKLKSKAILIYDYLDEISDKIISFPLDDLCRRHTTLIRNADIILASAGCLYEEARKSRNHDVLLLPNGVDYYHFHISRNPHTIPPELQPICSLGKPVIGYFGALASWFDYGLIAHLAKNRPGYQIVLIGWDYDGSIHAHDLEKYPNIHFLGPRDYSRLPDYAIWFDVCVIPFILNTITRATSPIKLFEYMALGKPVVTTAMPECQKYQSVFVGKDSDDFLGKIDLALTCNADTEYLRLLDQEARENTWAARAASIDRILQSAYGRIHKNEYFK